MAGVSKRSKRRLDGAPVLAPRSRCYPKIKILLEFFLKICFKSSNKPRIDPIINIRHDWRIEKGEESEKCCGGEACRCVGETNDRRARKKEKRRRVYEEEESIKSPRVFFSLSFRFLSSLPFFFSFFFSFFFFAPGSSGPRKKINTRRHKASPR